MAAFKCSNVHVQIIYSARVINEELDFSREASLYTHHFAEDPSPML